MRIVGGKLRGRPLRAPKGKRLRPSAERLREALFDILIHADLGQPPLSGATLVDLFAGTGALGLEALSRGASHVVMIENDRAALSELRANIAALKAEHETRVIAGDATDLPLSLERYDFALLDPPYRSGLGPLALEELARKGWLKKGAFAVIELAAKEPFPVPADYELIEERRYGKGRIVILRLVRAGIASD
jgi:16S rRNA (guanine966-N2)-methyltransferase